MPEVACVVLSRAGWPGVEVGALAGAGAACFPPLESGGAPERRAELGRMVSIGVTSVSEPSLLMCWLRVPALTAEVIGRLVDKTVIGIATGAVLAAGRGCGALQPEMASISPHRALLMAWNSAFFSALMSSAVTL